MYSQENHDKIIRYCSEMVKTDYIMLNERFGVTTDQMNHIIDIGVSIVMHKLNMRPGGGFVQAVCENNLISASMRADGLMQRVLAYMAVRFADKVGHIQYEALK